ncbi:DUF5803 family protein [Haloarculaceae archaeon H-GB2-1]|nr:DUF5803 family protein [Haloarculaceae archaeon H-GB1-1]MEA5387339.1 DUF5803 family protein [Haloarculaceae archaeon H-GB11]MEA5408807.1 DUF5803 family protein [Haloarculaceae archaeon H-GB2-1]
MRNRHLLAVGLVAVLIALAGCSSFLGPSQPNPEDLNASAEYEWDTNATTSISISQSSYTSIVTVENRTELELYQRSDIGTEEPVKVSALRFRYPNGTVVNASAMTVENSREKTTITLPNESGQLAYTAPRHGKRFSTPVFVKGSHEITMPPKARIGVPLLSQAAPSGYSTSVEGDRMTVYWDDVERGPVIVRYYLQRDLYLFGGLFALLFVAGSVGALYYVRQIRELERQREEIGLDVETGDDDLDGRDPPPGMG